MIFCGLSRLFRKNNAFAALNPRIQAGSLHTESFASASHPVLQNLIDNRCFL
jgi:hypothetical protein